VRDGECSVRGGDCGVCVGDRSGRNGGCSVRYDDCACSVSDGDCGVHDGGCGVGDGGCGVRDGGCGLRDGGCSTCWCNSGCSVHSGSWTKCVIIKLCIYSAMLKYLMDFLLHQKFSTLCMSCCENIVRTHLERLSLFGKWSTKSEVDVVILSVGILSEQFY
jgi:hypothetical protein